MIGGFGQSFWNQMEGMDRYDDPYTELICPEISYWSFLDI